MPGPFKFDSQTVGQQIKLSKFPGYWDAKNVKLAGIDYVHTGYRAERRQLGDRG